MCNLSAIKHAGIAPKWKEERLRGPPGRPGGPRFFGGADLTGRRSAVGLRCCRPPVARAVLGVCCGEGAVCALWGVLCGVWGRSSGWVWDRVVRALWGVLGGFSMAWWRSGWVWILFFPLESLPRPALADWRWLGFEVSFVAVAAARRQITPTARSA